MSEKEYTEEETEIEGITIRQIDEVKYLNIDENVFKNFNVVCLDSRQISLSLHRGGGSNIFIHDVIKPEKKTDTQIKYRRADKDYNSTVDIYTYPKESE